MRPSSASSWCDAALPAAAAAAVLIGRRSEFCKPVWPSARRLCGELRANLVQPPRARLEEGGVRSAGALQEDVNSSVPRALWAPRRAKQLATSSFLPPLSHAATPPSARASSLLMPIPASSLALSPTSEATVSALIPDFSRA